MILAIDTATRWTGLALHSGTEILAEMGWRAHNTQTVELIPAIAQLLRRADLAPAVLQGIAVALGPGSYTGLRIGLGAAKGLALANQTPLMGIPTLDITAASVPRRQVKGPLVAVLEAGRQRVSYVAYRWQRQAWVAQHPPRNATWPELLGAVEETTTLAGEISAAGAELITVHEHARQLSPAASVRRPACLAELGWQRWQRGRFDDAQQLVPLYVRQPNGR